MKSLIQHSAVAGLFAALTFGAQAAQVSGVLVDKNCSGKMELRIVSPSNSMVGGYVSAQAHDKDCLMMSECQKNGYGVYTQDNKYLTFDDAGNKQAVALLKGAAGKLVNFEVEVTGDVQGDTIKVKTIRLR